MLTTNKKIPDAMKIFRITLLYVIEAPSTLRSGNLNNALRLSVNLAEAE